MRAAAVLLGGILLCGCRELQRPFGETPVEGTDAYWRGNRWTLDYLRADEYLAWNYAEAAFRVATMVETPDHEGNALFRPAGRSDTFRSKEFFLTRPVRAHISDVYRGRKVFVPENVRLSPDRALNYDGPERFPAAAREDIWREFEIENTSELAQGRVSARFGMQIIDVPVWSLRVRK